MLPGQSDRGRGIAPVKIQKAPRMPELPATPPAPSGAPTRAANPLADWHFAGTLRGYQAEVLEQVPATGTDPLHIVAPPGSGKTLLGLLLAIRDGRRALVLTPTVTIREQWQRTAVGLAPEPQAVSGTPEELADLTVLTYQMVSVVDASASPFEALARLAWLAELVQSGRIEAEADTWLTTLRQGNPAQYRTGIKRRSGRVRRELVQQEPAELARVLHPNALALLERLVDHGVETIILDECHHLLDHWAFVVAYLAGRIRERGGQPQLIGLTATLPSPDDEEAFENYSQLLGEVDYEVPTPAVVKEGHLAPYRDFVWFTGPTAPELAFIRKHETRLFALVRDLLATDDGVAFLQAQLQPGLFPETNADMAAPTALAALDHALAGDFFLTRSCALVLREVAPDHPLVAMLPPSLLERCGTEDLLGALARYALERLLPEPAREPLWAETKLSLADFGYHLTDRGIRRGRNPIELTLAASESKDHAAAAILRHELGSSEGNQVRAVVITDFAVHGSLRSTSGGKPAGALRCFDTLMAVPEIARLCPILLTGKHLRVRTPDAQMLAAALGEILGLQVEIVAASKSVAELLVPGAGSGKIVAAVSELVRRGTVRLIVGTRGLLGEGWDCPPVNTLIDLTSVATSSATQQLRGRSLRLDPAWPGKVAHNWSVACLIPANVAIDTPAEMSRLQRKHSHLWGLSAVDNASIVTGLEHALHPAEHSILGRVLAKDKRATTTQVNAGVAARMRSRAQSYMDWRVGEPYAAQEQEILAVQATPENPVIRSGPALAVLLSAFFIGAGAVFAAMLRGLGRGSTGAMGWQFLLLAVGLSAVVSAAVFGPALVRGIRQRARPTTVYYGAALAIARTLHEAGRIGEFGESNIVVRERETAASGNGEAKPLGVSVAVSGGSLADRRIIADALGELFSPVRNPRFLIRVDRGALGRLSSLFTAPLALLDRLLPHRTLLPVPALIGKRRADAERFENHWRKTVGAATLHELKGTQGLELLRQSRTAGSRLDTFEPRRRGWA